MFAFVFGHHQVRGAVGTHSIAAITYSQAECLMKCRKVTEKKIKQAKHAGRPLDSVVMQIGKALLVDQQIVELFNPQTVCNESVSCYATVAG